MLFICASVSVVAIQSVGSLHNEQLDRIANAYKYRTHDKHVFAKIPEIVQELVLLLSFRRYDTNQIPL